MSHQQDIFGTTEDPDNWESVSLGALQFLVSEVGVRRVKWHDVELVRAVDFPLRDAEWGTLLTFTRDVFSATCSETFHYQRQFLSEDGCVAGNFRLEAGPDGQMTLELDLTTLRDVELCRAGFTVLHPIDELAGAPLTIIKTDGTPIQTTFPLLISPSQPATDFVGMHYEVDGRTVDVSMAGDVFEMEDQRNWSDASYKTYVRTASFPLPYLSQAGERSQETILLKFGGSSALKEAPRKFLHLQVSDPPERFPNLALAAEDAWGDDALPPSLDGLRRLVRVDGRSSLDLTWLGGKHSLVDLEVIVGDDQRQLTTQLTHVRDSLDANGVRADHVVAMPAAYLRSYQPDGPWPTGATPADAVAAARSIFPSARIGGGALTYFPELNRCRPDATTIDYITHGTTAIVHAADDLSVCETLQSLPHIFRSARAIAPAKPYRLGLMTIGSRCNPYGASLRPNSENRRITLTEHDPRWRGLFGAAWIVGVAAATQGAGVELLTLAGSGGPFGAFTSDGGAAPAFHVLKYLSSIQGARRLNVGFGCPAVHALAAVSGRGVSIVAANGSSEATRISWGGSARVAILDASMVETAATNVEWIESAWTVQADGAGLPPYAVAFIELDALEDIL